MVHIRDIYNEFEERGARVVSILAESLPRMQEFLRNHDYPFPLLSDVRREVVKAYGVYVRVNFGGGVVAGWVDTGVVFSVVVFGVVVLV